MQKGRQEASEEMKYSQVSNILAERKLKLGMSENYIAKKSELSQPTVHRILSGKHKKAKFNDVLKIASVLGMVDVSLVNK